MKHAPELWFKRDLHRRIRWMKTQHHLPIRASKFIWSEWSMKVTPFVLDPYRGEKEELQLRRFLEQVMACEIYLNTSGRSFTTQLWTAKKPRWVLSHRGEIPHEQLGHMLHRVTCKLTSWHRVTCQVGIDGDRRCLIMPTVHGRISQSSHWCADEFVLLKHYI